MGVAAGIEIAVDHLLDGLVTGELLDGGVGGVGDGVADSYIVEIFDGGDEVTDFPRSDAFGRPVRSAEIHVIGGHGELVASTVADGSFAFSEVPSGNYEVAVVLGGREVGHLKALHLSATSSPSRLTLASGGRLLVSQHGR